MRAETVSSRTPLRRTARDVDRRHCRRTDMPCASCAACVRHHGRTVAVIGTPTVGCAAGRRHALASPQGSPLVVFVRIVLPKRHGVREFESNQPFGTIL